MPGRQSSGETSCGVGRTCPAVLGVPFPFVLVLLLMLAGVVDTVRGRSSEPNPTAVAAPAAAAPAATAAHDPAPVQGSDPADTLQSPEARVQVPHPASEPRTRHPAR